MWPSVAQESARSDPGDEMPEARATRLPRARRLRRRGARRRCLVDCVRDLLERVERAGVDVPGLGADDRRARARLQSAPAAPRDASAPAPSAGSGSICARADPEIAQRAVDRDVALLARRGRGSAALPGGRRAARSQPAPREHVVPCCGESGHVRHLAAGDEARRHAFRQAEQLAQPRERDLLHHRRARRRRRRGRRSDPRSTSSQSAASAAGSAPPITKPK